VILYESPRGGFIARWLVAAGGLESEPGSEHLLLKIDPSAALASATNIWDGSQSHATSAGVSREGRLDAGLTHTLGSTTKNEAQK
jgi:hypothetical protein